MSRTLSPVPRSVAVKVALTIRGRKFDLELGVIADTVSAEAMLPLFRSFAESFVDVAVKEAEAQGKKISCQKGCGACCRQLVPISAIEARQLAKMIEQMPPVRRQIIRQRFANARRKLDEAGLLESLLRPQELDDQRRESISAEYFSLGIACPFLEFESCSIHPERPIACREYLVTSPAQNCASPRPEKVERIASPVGDVWTWVARMDERATADYSGWIPLILGLDYVANYPVEPPPRPGNEWVEEFFRFVCKKPQESSPQEAKSA